MITEPQTSRIDALIGGQKFKSLFDSALANHPEDSIAASARWAFIQLMGWHGRVPYDERFSAARLTDAEKNALNYVYSIFSGIEFPDVDQDFNVLDYVKTATSELGDNVAAVLPSAASLEWFARNAKWILPAAAVAFFAPKIITTYQTLKTR